MDRLGLDPETVPRRWPRLVNCSISGYGTTGPDKDRKALDLLIQGESGLPSVTGTRAEPCKVRISVAVMCAAMYARSGILAALRARERTDLGDYIDISMLESMVDWMGAPLYLQMYRNSAPTRNEARQHDRALRALRDWGRGGGEHRGPDAGTVGEPVPCRARSPELTSDERFGANDRRVAHREQLDLILGRGVRRPHRSVRLGAARAGRHPLRRREAARGRGRPRAAGSARPLDHRADTQRSGAGPESPFNLRGVPRKGGRVPRLGQDTASILAELDVLPQLHPQQLLLPSMSARPVWRCR